jgi:hypothetical protein
MINLQLIIGIYKFNQTKISVMKYLIIFLLILSSLNSFSQIGIVEVIAGGEVVKNIINKFERSASVLLDQAKNSGNILIAKAGNEMNVAVKNATILLANQMNNTFDHLNNENQKLLNEIEKFRITAEKLSNNTFDLKDALVIDLKTILGDALPWSRTDFYVQRVKGATQLYGSQTDYSLKVLGIGFGFNQENFESKTTGVLINDENVAYSDEKISGNESEIKISYNDLNKFCTNSKVSQIKLKIVVETRRKSGLIFKSWSSKHFELPLTITILPRTVNNIVVSYSFPKIDWVTINPFIEYSHLTTNHHQTGSPILHFAEIKEVRLPDNQRFTNGRQGRGPEGWGCPWTTLQSVNITEGGKLLTAKFDLWGGPCTYYFGATLEEFKESGSQEMTLPVTVFEYGKNFVIELPKGTKYWRIQGKTIDFKDIDIVGKADYENFVSYQNDYELGDKYRVVYRIGLPY